MANRTMGEMICTLRREKGMTQRELAEKLNITDKAVSKWERDLAYPDTATIPLLSEMLGISVEELMNAKAGSKDGHKGAEYFIDIVTAAMPVAMGVAVTVTSMLGDLDVTHALTMLGIGLSCVGIKFLHDIKL